MADTASLEKCLFIYLEDSQKTVITVHHTCAVIQNSDFVSCRRGEEYALYARSEHARVICLRSAHNDVIMR